METLKAQQAAQRLAVEDPYQEMVQLYVTLYRRYMVNTRPPCYYAHYKAAGWS
jgi:hypothetical protein